MSFTAPDSPLDDAIFAELFSSEGAQPLLWEQVIAPTPGAGLTSDSLQPRWGEPDPAASGNGIEYQTGVVIYGLFRSRGQWLSYRRQGEIEIGDAELTTPLSVKPGFVSRLIRDRITVLPTDDATVGRAFFPAAPPVPFLFGGVQYAWRVALQADRRDQELAP